MGKTGKTAKVTVGWILDPEVARIRPAAVYVSEWGGAAMEEGDKVILPDGRTGYIIHVFKEGEAYLVEFATPDGPHRYDNDVYKPEELKPAD